MHNEIVCNSVSEMSHFYPESFSEKSRSVHIEILKKISIKIKIWKFFYLKINKIFYLKSISPKKLILYAVRSCPDYVWNLSEIRAQIKWTPCILNSSNFLSVICVIYCKIFIVKIRSYSTVETEIRDKYFCVCIRLLETLRTVKPRFTAQFGGTERGAVNRG